MAPPIIEGSWPRRVLWFVLLWSAGVLVVGTVAFVLRLPLKLLG